MAQSRFNEGVIRQVSLDDLDELTRLYGGYRVFYKQSSDPEQERIFLRQRIENNESIILIAESEEGIGMGFTQLYPLFSSVRMKPIWLLNDLYVDSSHRKKGVGHALMEAAEDFAKKSGAAGLELATAKDNVEAKSVYESRGWQLDTEYDHYSFTV